MNMKRRRPHLIRIDDVFFPLLFVMVFHTLIHILGIFMVIQLPYTWQLGMPSRHASIPAFGLVVWISTLSLVWACLRFCTSTRQKVPALFILIVPVVMSAGTIVYAHTATKCADVGRQVLLSKLAELDSMIDDAKDTPWKVRWEIEERNRMFETFEGEPNKIP